MQQLKGQSSTHIKKWMRDHLTAYTKQISPDEPVWQVRFHSFEIDQRDKLEEKLNYMHLNPVRAGLVERCVDWKWSSARWYAQQRSVGLPIEWVE